MENKQTEKSPIVTTKSFLAAGPSLHYSHENVVKHWLLSLVVFGTSCLFWSKILTGSLWAFNFQALTSPKLWRLGQFAITGVSIFEYPWQIFVLGLLLGILAIVPVLISQLWSFRYSLPFILAAAFLANLPAFAVCLLISCIAAACRPLRFRSRFVAIALCIAPQLFYWGCFGGARGIEPIKLGFSFAPWICAGIVGMAIAGVVLGIGHFTRYRPGVVWMVTLFTLLTAIIVFETKIGFAELDYQLYVAKNDPEHVSEFRDYSITKALDDTITNPGVVKYLADFFYPTESIPLRAELKKEIQVQLSYDRWPTWFLAPEKLKYQAKRQWLCEQYDLFISRRHKSHRMPIALYYKAILSEYSPDIRDIGEREILHFYSDYPHERSREIWYRLYREFGQSPESIEARLRIAQHWAGQGRFEQASKLLADAETMIAERLKLLEGKKPQIDTLFSPFRPPADTVMTAFKLVELQRQISQLTNLINSAGRTAETKVAEHLRKFIMLNQHTSDYADRLGELLGQMSNNDPLRDNVLLAQIKLIADDQLRAEKLNQLHKEFNGTDGGIQALYELALLKINLWRQQNESNPELKKQCLADARATLTSFINLYPVSIFTDQVKKNLEDLPAVDKQQLSRKTGKEAN